MKQDLEHIAEEALGETIAEVEAEEINESEQLRCQIAELSDKYMRAVAEIENTRRRAKTDVESIARSRAMAVAESFLTLVDAIDAAVKHSPDDAGIKALTLAASGVLAAVGIVKIETVGQTLNPQFHNAVQTAEDEKSESGIIIEEFQPGYMFEGTVLRPAMVVVAK
ncbi:MAG: nucleotide exchange factor GrpE [Alphaproteobacteria bacterium]|nr:nucleotide exchange factor GrpE [Alphaproteobacteria bacterium]